MNEYQENYTRRISLEEDFMNYNSDDLLYGALQYLATYHPTIKEIYLTKKNYTKHRQDLCFILGLNTRNIKNHLDKLIEKGLIKEKTIKVGKEDYPSYVFPYNYEDKYQLVNNEMLWYIVSTRNQHAVRIYIKLLSWYKWKSAENDNYIFTNRELMGAIGYSTNSKQTTVSGMITNILESFKREGVIDYEDYYEEMITNNGEIVRSPKKRLWFVASTKSEIK